MKKLNRRGFLTAFTSSIIGFGLSKNLKAEKPLEVSQEVSVPFKILKYNELGKTGIKVSDVSCGAISFFEPNVLRYAYELGVNYFDTAEGYMRTQSESLIGEALKEIRNRIIITTKHGLSPRVKKEDITQRMEESLKRMRTDYVDIAMVHGVSDLALLKNEEIQAAYSQLKKEGKIRFTGFSTHNPKLTLKQVLEDDFAQVVLLIYNHLEGKEIEPLIKEARRQGVGIVAMKVFAGGMHGNLRSLISKEVSYPQAAIRWVLSNPDVDCCIVTMSSYSHVEEYVATSGKSLTRADMGLIATYKEQASRHYCRVSCQECLDACPNNVAINDVLRYKMYFENYRMEKEAMRYYADLEETSKPFLCNDCKGFCESACRHGLKVRDKLIQAHQILKA